MFAQTLLRTVKLLGCCLLLSACTHSTQLQIKNLPARTPDKPSTAMAGVAVVDITPQPGMPKSGYSILAKDGDGFRTRLKARIFYLKDASGQATALVQADLQGASLLLQHRVAELVAQHTDIDASRLAIMATHTHSSPGNIFASDFYNKHASNGKWLETRYFHFLSEQIAQGIISAYNTQRPARIATGKRDIYGYNRNRAIDSWLRNPDLHGLNPEDPELIYKAVNPSLFMVRIDARDKQGRYRPMGAFSSFSIHATTLSAPVTVYNADVFAYMHREVEWKIQQQHPTDWPVAHAMVNGTEGDMAPNLPYEGDRLFSFSPVDWQASETLGKAIAEEALALYSDLGKQLGSKLKIRVAAREINIREQNEVEGIRICDDAAAGNALAAGALERRTPWLAAMPFFKAGSVTARRWWFFKNGCQGNKRILGTSMAQPLLEPKDSFPDTVLFQLIQLNDMLIVPLPFEVTIESGQRMAQRLHSEFQQTGDSSLQHVAITSVSNGYFGYTTTPEEYDQQNYEGGHTLYGRNSTPYLTAQLGLLSRDMLQAQQPLAELPDEWTYELKTNQFYADNTTASATRRVIASPVFVEAEGKHSEDYWAFQWLDVPPALIDFHKPLARVEVSRDQGKSWQPLVIDGEPISDEGYDLSVHYLDEADNGGMGEYELHWYNPRAQQGQVYRFVVAARDQQATFYSPTFN